MVMNKKDDNKTLNSRTDTSKETKRLHLSDLSCASCVEAVESGLNSVQGVEEANVNFAERVATVIGDVSTDELIDAVIKAGYTASLIQDPEDEIQRDAAE